jgi:hypothetical protein
MELLQRRSTEISAKELAGWIDEQGGSTYWTVDGDPLLAGRLSLPCPGDELADELRKINTPLLVFDPPGLSHPSAAPPKLDDLVEREELGTRVLQFQWKGSDPIWLLIEDEETSESASRETSSN